ncbi:MAG: hypothetical protein K2X91_03425, partial [Thermoleophilia bacterium]|nr:hypothetical protein [Thermoleophilia bacterium]
APADLFQTDLGRELAADRERIEAALGQLRAAAAGLRADRAERLREWQQAAVEMAVAIAARVLHERVEAGQFAIDNKVRDMIAQLGDDSAVDVRLNPTDLTLLNERLGGAALSADGADVRFVPDPSLGRGECLVEGREGMLLSDFTRELDEIRDDLLRSLKNARS